MLIYFILMIILVIGVAFDKTKYEKIYFWICSSIMLVFASIRGNGDGDYFNYIGFASKIQSLDNLFDGSVPVEIGFRLFSLLGNKLHLSEQFIIIIMSCLSIIPMVLLINKRSPYINLSLVVFFPYFLTMDMHSSRTAVSSVFCIYSLIYFYEKRYIISLLFFAFGLSFHSAAWVIILGVIVHFPLSLLSLFVVFSFFFNSFIGVSGFLVEMLNAFGLNAFAMKVENYFLSGKYAYPVDIYDPRALLYLLITFLGLALVKKYEKNEIFYVKVFFIGACIFFLMSDATILSVRLSYFFTILNVILIPVLSQKINLIIYSQFGSKRIGTVFFSLVYMLLTFGFLNKYVEYTIFN